MRRCSTRATNRRRRATRRALGFGGLLALSSLPACSTEAYCDVAVPHCDALDATQCGAAAGCSWAEGCFPLRCPELRAATQAVCEAVPHCKWNLGCSTDPYRAAESKCYADAGTCSARAACEQRMGCAGKPMCSGHAAKQACQADPTCFWYEVSNPFQLAWLGNSVSVERMFAGAQVHAP